MRRLKTMFANGKQRGSALLVTLMVMVGLSLLGLGFVTISETESAISVNERNYAQTLHVAEGGTRTVSEWFNAPEWAIDNGLVPENADAGDFKNDRPSGIYRPIVTDTLFDYPFKSSDADRFFGINEDNADFIIDRTTADGQDFLDSFNAILFPDADDIDVVEIAIYAPPIVGATIVTHTNGLQFYDGGTRYGVATVAVTAQKTRNGDPDTGQVIAQRTVKAVVAEFPFPGPEGPLQSKVGIGLSGAFTVHWGKVVSLANAAINRNHSALPWLNAWNIIPWEEGYDPYYDTADPQYFHELIGMQWEDPWFEVRAVGSINTSNPGAGVDAASGTYQPWPYTGVNDDENRRGFSGLSGQFQLQTEDDQPNKRQVNFNRPVYAFWKQIALTGATQQGIYYLRRNSTTGQWYDVTGDSRLFRDWVNVEGNGEEGFFFFDTSTAGDPQNADGTTNTGILTPAISLNSSDGNPFLMRGFFYLNAVSFGTTGLSDDGRYYNSPGEPFRDIGFQLVDTATGELMCESLADPEEPILCSDAGASTTPYNDNITNYQWDFQDLNDNGRFDVKVTQTTSAIVRPGSDNSGSPIPTGTWVVVPYDPSCGLAGLPDPSSSNTGTCSEPHEPYLNLLYPSASTTTAGNAIQTGSNPLSFFTVGWQDPTSSNRIPKKTDADGQPSVTCTNTDFVLGGPSDDNCTSNAYDDIGAVMKLSTGNSAGAKGAVLDGVLYNEGNYNSQGNAIYYGSILIWGSVTGTGNPDVWFDYSLKKGDWQDRFENLPRTIITSLETDQ